MKEAILYKAQTSYANQLPFVIYKKPMHNSVTGIFQKTATVHYSSHFSEQGFVFAPFNAKENAILFPLKASELMTEVFVEMNSVNNSTLNPFEVDSKSHITIVEKGITAINNGQFQKVVLSRKEIVEVPNFEIISAFTKMLALYPNAFVYCWFHPSIGLWLGASPETLLNVHDNSFKTMSLAGTQSFSEDAHKKWTLKETEEQEIVTKSIVENLDFVKDLHVSETKTIKAGSLCHLQTIISGTLAQDYLEKTIRSLHPTPAICGFPRKEAKQFILENEAYKRSYYTGFLGEINMNSTTSLYVNLRCMQIQNKEATIYIGGGITKDSNPTKEWEETVKKAGIMKSVL